MIPELTVFGIQKTERFYLDIPGFRLEYGCEEAYFLFASFGESRFMLEQFHEDGRNTAGCEPVGVRCENFYSGRRDSDFVQAFAASGRGSLPRPSIRAAV